MFVCCECCVLSGRGLCDELITRPEEFYRLWCIVVCDLETSRMRRLWPALGRSATGNNNNNNNNNNIRMNTELQDVTTSCTIKSSRIIIPLWWEQVRSKRPHIYQAIHDIPYSIHLHRHRCVNPKYRKPLTFNK